MESKWIHWLSVMPKILILGPFLLGIFTFDFLTTRTGGYKFAPNNVDSAVAICELESFLATSERPIMNQGALGHSYERFLSS